MPTPEEDREITRAALEDPDAQPLTDEQLERMVPLRSLRGRPVSARRKLQVTVRYSPEVIAWFKATGDGWQTRMDEVLRSYVTRQTRKSRTPPTTPDDKTPCSVAGDPLEHTR